MRVLTHGSPAAAVQYFEFLRKAQLLDGRLSIAKVARTRTLARQSRCAMRAHTDAHVEGATFVGDWHALNSPR